MSQRKKITRAKRRAAAAEQKTLDVLAQMGAYYRAVEDRLRALDQALAPAVQRLFAIRLNDAWYFPDPQEMLAHRAAIDEQYLSMPETRKRRIDTHRDLQIQYVVPNDVLRELLTHAPNRYLEAFVVDAGARCMREAIRELGLEVPREDQPWLLRKGMTGLEYEVFRTRMSPLPEL